MVIKLRLILTALFLSILLIACGDDSNNSAEAPQVEQKSVSTIAMSDAKIELGMTEKAVADLLGTPQSTQTRSIEALTITHTEWTDKSGTVSVQFINGEVKFNLFTASN
ncbi:MAG: hypothetical protein HRT92_00395 [Piscirickettsiaceae bacterium]|nr:hypothetical protein [Piscirickettsiaceae bacterium]